MDSLLRDTVFERTNQGRVTVLKQNSGLNPQEQRLLLMVTGYTPLADLLALLDDAVPQEAAAAVVDELLQRQLIRAVEGLPHGARMAWGRSPGVATGRLA